MKTLITGGAGFIGSHLAKLIPNAVILDRKPKRSTEHVYYHADIRDDLRDIVPQFDRIYHLAALTDVQESIEDPDEYWSVNVDGTKNLCSLIESHQELIFASTAAAIDPVSPYGRSKRAAEKIILSSGGTVVRFYNVFGPESKGVITYFIDAALHGAPLNIYGDGLNSRTFVHVEDIARHLAHWRFNKVHYNPVDPAFIGGAAWTIEGLAQCIIHLTGSYSTIEYSPARDGEVRESVALDESYDFLPRLRQQIQYQKDRI